MNTNLPFDKMMIVRTALLLVAWLNQFLVIKGLSPLPFSNDETEFVVSSAITFIMSMWAWWKDNNVTYKARRVDKYIEQKGLK